MSFIFINECKNCKEKFEMKYKYWYSEEEIDLCENCFIESLSKEECRGTNKKLCDNINCKKCYLASFASHEKSKYWSKNNYIKIKWTTASEFPAPDTDVISSKS